MSGQDGVAMSAPEQMLGSNIDEMARVSEDALRRKGRGIGKERQGQDAGGDVASQSGIDSHEPMSPAASRGTSMCLKLTDRR